MKATGVALCVLAILLGACATIANTPQQDLAYAQWAKCNSSFPVVLERVDLDGRITFWLSNGRSQEALQCLAAASHTGPLLPEPLGVLEEPYDVKRLLALFEESNRLHASA